MIESSPLVPIKSPLALTGVFLCILRERFHEKYELPWKWYSGDEGRLSSTILIEDHQNPETEDFGRRPAIYVQRAPIQYSQIAIGDEVDRERKSNKRIYNCAAQTHFTFACEAGVSAEAEILADIVLSTLMMGSDVIESYFDFRKLGPFALSASAKTRQDVDITQVNVQMGLSFDVRWGSQGIAPILKEVIVKARESTYTDSEDYFVQIYQHSLNDRLTST